MSIRPKIAAVLAVMLTALPLFSAADETQNKFLSAVKKHPYISAGAIGLPIIAGTTFAAYRYMHYQQVTNLLMESYKTRSTYVRTNKDKSKLKFATEEERLEVLNFLAKNNGFVEAADQVPSSVADFCCEYVGPVPEYVQNLIVKALKDTDIKEPVFFYQTSDTSHAITRPFSQVGLHLSDIIVHDPEHRKLFAAAGRLRAREERFLRTIYHELCHIKAGHYEFAYVFADMRNAFLRLLQRADLSPEIKARVERSKNVFESIVEDWDVYRAWTHAHMLFKEMEAELGAVYYVTPLYQANKVSYAQEHVFAQRKHPQPDDQNRYNALLLEQLRQNPTAPHAIVKELAKAYILEDTPGFSLFFEAEDALHAANEEMQATMPASSCSASSASSN